jgi:hypothetical protein
VPKDYEGIRKTNGLRNVLTPCRSKHNRNPLAARVHLEREKELWALGRRKTQCVLTWFIIGLTVDWLTFETTLKGDPESAFPTNSGNNNRWTLLPSSDPQVSHQQRCGDSVMSCITLVVLLLLIPPIYFSSLGRISIGCIIMINTTAQISAFILEEVARNLHNRPALHLPESSS